MKERILWILTGGAATLGGGLLYISSLGLSHSSGSELWYSLVRDIGIAFVVAALVAAIYELHARARFDRATVTSVLGAIYNDIVDGSVWTQIEKQVLERKFVRKNGQIRIGLQEHEGLLKGQQILWVEFEYDLTGLRSTHQHVEVRHFLDSFMDNPKLKLPRFDQIVIGEKIIRDGLDGLEGGVFTRSVAVNGRHGAAIHVVVERHEIVYVPGAYNLIMGELTDGVRVHLAKASPSIAVEVNMKNRVQPLGSDGYLLCKEFFLPGQCVEFRFKPKPTERAGAC